MAHHPSGFQRPLFLMAMLALAVVGGGCGQQPRQPTAARQPGVSPAYCPPETPAYCPPAPVAAPTLSLAGKVVILDPGHGGENLGANYFGVQEKNVNLDLANRVAGQLRAKGATVHLTRTTDVFVPLDQRSAFANRHPGAIFVSIHVNASGNNPNAAGIETFVLSKDFGDAERSRTASQKYRVNGDATAEGRQALASLVVDSRARGPALAQAIQKQLVTRLGETDRGVKTANLAVLRETYFCPAVLVETGFVSHRPTADRMRTEDWRQRTSTAIAEGISEFLRQS